VYVASGLSPAGPEKKREPSESITTLNALDTMDTSDLLPTGSAQKLEQREGIIALDALGAIANQSDLDRSWKNRE
jgi:hypothetical protein